MLLTTKKAAFISFPTHLKWHFNVSFTSTTSDPLYVAATSPKNEKRQLSSSQDYRQYWPQKALLMHMQCVLIHIMNGGQLRINRQDQSTSD